MQIDSFPCMWCGTYWLQTINESNKEINHKPQVACINPQCESRGPKRNTREEAIAAYYDKKEDLDRLKDLET